MAARWQFMATPFSYFSAKIRPLLRYKNVDYEEIAPTPAVYREVIRPATGSYFIPVLISGDEVLQDTPRMVEAIEALHPEPAVLPADPVLRLVAEVIQDFADEAMILPAMHFRWSFPEQRAWIEHDWSVRTGPESARMAERMSSSLPPLGISDRTRPLIDEWFNRLLEVLDFHLDGSRFLLGDRVSLADIAMAGPMHAHLGRDPVPARRMRAHAPLVMAWLAEVNEAAPPAPWANDFEFRNSLGPLLSEIGRVFVPMQLVASGAAAAEIAHLAPGEPVPRVLGMAEQPVLGVSEQRWLNSYSAWRHARTAERYKHLADDDRTRADQLLRARGLLPYLREAPEPAPVMDGFELRRG
ncbi:MAG: glutathione S-transferase [Proteobacteria bacterium]|nr:glutathione S-transferase [Pseudomonadota bacterium]